MPDTKKKRSSPPPNFSVYVPHLPELRAVAYALGYVAKTGPHKGGGSIQALLDAIATGEVRCERRRVESKGKAGGSK